MTNKENITPSKSTSTLSPQYVMKRMIIDKNNLKRFITDEENRRMIRLGKVKDLLKNIGRGTHFNSPFVVNERERNIFALIDGNHRYEAIALKIANDSNFKIAVWVAVYRNLTRMREKEVYRLWNIGISQSATDFLKLYFETIPYGKEMLKRLPVTIYGDDTHINLKLLVGSYISTKKQGNFSGGYSGGRETIIGDFCKINGEDIEVMKEYCDFMEKVFGEFHKTNNSLFYKTTPFIAFLRIWYDNKESIKENKMISIFKKVFASNVGAWKTSCEIGSRNMAILIYKQSIESLNALQKREYFKSDKEIVPEKNKIKEILQIVEQRQ